MRLCLFLDSNGKASIISLLRMKIQKTFSLLRIKKKEMVSFITCLSGTYTHYFIKMVTYIELRCLRKFETCGFPDSIRKGYGGLPVRTPEAEEAGSGTVFYMCCIINQKSRNCDNASQ